MLNENQQALYDYAMSYLGTPYVWGGNGPNQIDCSGLVLELLKAAGVIKLSDMSAQGMYDYLTNPASLSNIVKAPQFGALVFFGKGPKQVSHVGFCVSSILMIEAGGGDSTCTTKEIAFQKQAFVKLRTVTHRTDIVGFVLPLYPWS